MVKEPDAHSCNLSVSKHFRNTWMRKWDWDYHILRDAIANAYRVEKSGKYKFEAFTRKKGGKKIIFVYQWETDTIFVITGSEGK